MEKIDAQVSENVKKLQMTLIYNDDDADDDDDDDDDDFDDDACESGRSVQR